MTETVEKELSPIDLVLPPIDVAFAKYRNLIFDTVHKFLKAKPGTGTFEELESDAYFAFCDAYSKYQNRGDRPIIGKGRWHFGGWLKLKIGTWLLEFHRRRFKKSVFAPMSLDVTSKTSEGGVSKSMASQIPDHRNNFNLDRCFKDSSPDARMALAFVCGGIDANPDAKRRMLAEHLVEIGWSGPRILACFAEIKSVLESA